MSETRSQVFCTVSPNAKVESPPSLIDLRWWERVRDVSRCQVRVEESFLPMGDVVPVIPALPGFSAAGTALGFGNNALANQFQPEDEQARKKRLAAMNAAQGNIGLRLGAGYGAALGSYSPAGSMLFGGR